MFSRQSQEEIDRIAALSEPRKFVFSGSPPRGLPGVPGATGPSGSGTIYVSKQNIALDALSKGELVYDVSSTEMARALASDPVKKNVMSMIYDDTIPPGGSGQSIVSGVVSKLIAEWDTLLGTIGGLAVGQTYFLDGTVPGRMTVTAPSTGWAVAVGFAINSTDFFVRIEPSVKL